MIMIVTKITVPALSRILVYMHEQLMRWPFGFHTLVLNHIYKLSSGVNELLSHRDLTCLEQISSGSSEFIGGMYMCCLSQGARGSCRVTYRR